jgi:eukaryotic-like serine/threonine-protein kinase
MKRPATADDARLSLTGLLHLDRACDRFEAALRAGGGPELEPLLAGAPAELRPRLLHELLALELAARTGRGERPDAADYRARFPDLGAVVEKVFAAGQPGEALPPASLDPAVAGSLRAGGYEVLGELGRGGMGVVYLARKVALNRPCALKMFSGGAAASPTAAARLRAEAEAVARVRHPNVVQIYHVGDAAGLPFLELEYLAGGSLAGALDGTPRPAAEAARLVETLAHAAAEAHRLGVVHRDLKPGNILLTADGEPKVGDFGLAKLLASDSRLTCTGQVVGTPCYMAPEQAEARAGEVGPAADVYSLGAILYELLTGHPPFKAATVLQTLDLVRSQEPVPPRRAQPAVPRDLETVCLKCLHKDPRRRYAGAAALADELGRFGRGRPVLARPTGAPERAWKWARRQPAVATLSAALVATAALSFALVCWQWRRAEGKAAAEAVARVAARQSRRDAVKGQAQLALHHGQSLCEQGEIGRGLVWLVRGLELATEAGADGLDRAARMNLAEWSARLSRPLARFTHPAPVVDLSFRPDGRTLVARGEDGALRSWDTETRRETDPPLDDGAGRGDLARALSPDGRTLAAAAEDGRVVRSEVATGRRLGPVLSHDSPVRAIAFSADARRLLTVTRDGRLHVWDPEVARVSDLPPEGAAVVSLAVSPDGERFATGTDGGTVRLWDPATLRQTGQPYKLVGGVRALAFRPDGRALAVGHDDGTIQLWAIPPSGVVGPPRRVGGPVRTVSFRGDGRRLLAVGDRGARWWDLGRPAARGTGEPTALPQAEDRPGDREGPTLGVTAASPDGRLLALAETSECGGGARSRITLRDAGTGAFLRATPWQPDPLVGLVFSPDSRRLLTWGPRPGSAALREVETPGQARPLVRSAGLAIQQAAFSRDGGTLLLGCRDGSARLWDVARDAESVLDREAAPHHAYPITAVAFDPRAKMIVTGCHAGTVRLWDRTSGRLVHDVRGNAGEVAAVAFSPDGETLLTASLDATARFWDVRSGLQLGPPLYHSDAVLSVAFHPDGRSVATGTRDGTTRLWRGPSAPLRGDVDQIRQRVAELTGLQLDDQGAVFTSSDPPSRRHAPSR